MIWLKHRKTELIRAVHRVPKNQPYYSTCTIEHCTVFGDSQNIDLKYLQTQLYKVCRLELL